jgi:hypothetical protein
MRIENLKGLKLPRNLPGNHPTSSAVVNPFSSGPATPFLHSPQPSLTNHHLPKMLQTLRLSVSQSHTLSTTSATLSALESTVKRAHEQSVDLILFPEAYLGGYPRTATFGAAVGARKPEGREQFLQYYKDAVDLGDTPSGAGNAWINKELERPKNGARGDGTREELERIARENGVFVITGVVERCAGTLYCAVVYVCPREGVVGKRRKVMPVCFHPISPFYYSILYVPTADLFKRQGPNV